MKYFISLDMEGVAGLASWSETSQEQRELMTGETCAAIEGIRSVDKEAAIVIADSHSRGQNLLLDRLPQDVQVVRGYPRPLYMVEGADESCDAALFVGYHAPIGTQNGSMDHTYSSASIYEVLANGHVVGETEFNMVLLAPWVSHSSSAAVMSSTADSRSNSSPTPSLSPPSGPPAGIPSGR